MLCFSIISDIVKLGKTLQSLLSLLINLRQAATSDMDAATGPASLCCSTAGTVLQGRSSKQFSRQELTVATKASAICLAADRTWCGGNLGTRWLITLTQHSKSAAITKRCDNMTLQRTTVRVDQLLPVPLVFWNKTSKCGTNKLRRSPNLPSARAASLSCVNLEPGVSARAVRACIQTNTGQVR